MELRHLRYLIAAVEEGSLQGAAQRVNVAQPALSRRIRDLEATLGCELFVRGPRGVTPTRAGTVLYREALTLLEGLERASEQVRRVGREEGKVVRLGLVRASSKYAFVREGVAAYKAARPPASVAFTRATSQDLALALREGRLDITLLYERRLGSRGFGERLIHKERYVLAVHPAHRLARRRPADLADLAGEPLVWLSRHDNADHHDALMQQCRLHGLEPVIGHTAMTQDEQIELAITSEGLCLTPASTVLSTPRGVLVFRPLRSFGMELHLSLAWSPHLEGSPAGLALAGLHAAIDRHQAAVTAGADGWSRLLGQQVVVVPEAAEG